MDSGVPCSFHCELRRGGLGEVEGQQTPDNRGVFWEGTDRGWAVAHWVRAICQGPGRCAEGILSWVTRVMLVKLLAQPGPAGRQLPSNRTEGSSAPASQRVTWAFRGSIRFPELLGIFPFTVGLGCGDVTHWQAPSYKGRCGGWPWGIPALPICAGPEALCTC